MKPKILLIDAWNIIIAQNSVANITDHNCTPIGMYLTTINQIRNFVDKFKPSKVFFVMDGPNAGERRRQLYPDYKGRSYVKESKVVFKYDENEEKEVIAVDGSFKYQLKKIYEFLKLLPVTVCIVPYCEADDIITYISLKNQEVFDIIITSTDKDYCQHINENISVYNWRTHTLIDKNIFLEKFNILPSNYIFKKIVRGDDSDKIEGIKGIGEKTFCEIFNELKEKEIKDISGFFQYINEINIGSLAKKNHKHVSLLKESEKKLLLSYRLMKLSVDYLKLNHIDLLKKQIEEQENKTMSRFSLKILLMKDSFNKLSKDGSYFNTEKWSQPFIYVKSNLKIEL